MRTEKEIIKLRNDWVKLRNELLECGDTVSLVVAGHALFYINTLDYVLGVDEKL